MKLQNGNGAEQIRADDETGGSPRREDDECERDPSRPAVIPGMKNGV